MCPLKSSLTRIYARYDHGDFKILYVFSILKGNIMIRTNIHFQGKLNLKKQMRILNLVELYLN